MNYLDKPQMRRLLAAARANSELHWLMILVGYTHGLRVSEVLSLTHANIRDGFLTVQRLKGSLKTTQALVASEDPFFDEKTALTDLLAVTPKTDKLFPLHTNLVVGRVYFWRLMRKYGKQAEIPAHKRHPHVLKYSCGMAIIPAGIEYTRQYLGHRSVASTGAYIRVSDEVTCQKVQGLL